MRRRRRRINEEEEEDKMRRRRMMRRRRRRRRRIFCTVFILDISISVSGVTPHSRDSLTKKQSIKHIQYIF